jgi:hypothetical protein
MFTAALLTIAKLWNQPRCPTTNEWIKKIVLCNGVLFSHNEDYVVCRWMELELEIILLSEVRFKKTSIACSLSCEEHRAKKKKKDMNVKGGDYLEGKSQQKERAEKERVMKGV